MTILTTTPSHEIDWDSPGARLYHVPFTFDNSWGRQRLPLFIACGPRPGPTIAAIGGTHGDEYEGPVGLKRLINGFDPAALVAGRLIVIPVLSVSAFQAARRDSPADGRNMNRVFPGRADGTLSERVAHFVSSEVFPRADVVIDIHAAGQTMEMARCTSFHELSDPEQFRQTREAALLFGMPFVMVYTGGMGSGLLTEAAESLGKVTIGGEFGYGAAADLQGVRWAHHGTLNVMRRYGLLDEPVDDLLPPGVDRQRVVWATDIDHYVTAPLSGIVEPLVPLGSHVEQGQPVARIHDFERIGEPGLEIPADLDGYVITRRFKAAVTQGDVVMVIGKELESEPEKEQ